MVVEREDPAPPGRHSRPVVVGESGEEGKNTMSSCNGGMFCDGTRPMTGAERRAYNQQVSQLGGYGSPAAQAFVESEHQRFLAGRRAHQAQHGGCCVVLISLVGTLAALTAFGLLAPGIGQASESSEPTPIVINKYEEGQ